MATSGFTKLQVAAMLLILLLFIIGLILSS